MLRLLKSPRLLTTTALSLGWVCAAPAQVTPMYAIAVPQTADPLFANLTIPQSAATQGMWSATQAWPLVGIHISVLPDGRVLTFGTPLGQGVQDGRTLDLWDPRQGFAPASHLTISNGQMVDSFCGTATLLPSGTLLVSGGGSTGDGYTSFASTLVNSAASTAVASSSTLAAQRWYATMITLADGRALITGGSTPYTIVNAYANPSGAEANISETPEVYSPSTGWSSLLGARSADAFGPINNRAWYPRQWVAGDGSVFGISTDKIWRLDPTGSGSIQTLGTFKTAPDKSTTPNVGPTSTAVMYDTGKILQAGGNGYYNNYPSPSSPFATIFDISNPTNPIVRDTQSMHYARQWGSSTVLPTGSVLVTGGSTYADQNGANAVYPAEIWNPATGAWTVGASAANYRGYHSAAVLLPDGAILSTGGGVPGPVTNLNAEIYYPPYLFATVNGKAVLANRPHIISLTTNAPAYGSQMSLQVGTGDVVASVSLIGLSSVTHSFNTGQRRQTLRFVQSASSVSVGLPASPSLAPPGYYLISVLNTKGVPSPGAIIALQASAPPQSSRTALLPVDGAVRSLEPLSLPGSLIRHANFVAWANSISPTSDAQSRDDASFYTRAGLGNSQCYSFESKNYPGYFLRHRNFQVGLAANDNSALFQADSTFCAVAGLSGTGVSLQSLNYPDHYMHVRSGSDVWIDTSDGTASFAQNASFSLAEVYLPTETAPHSFGVISVPGELIRHQNFVGYVSSIDSASPAGDRADASFVVHPGNASANCYSFEASNYKGYYLRHYNFQLVLNQNDNSAQFAQDSTFCMAGGLAGLGFSLTSFNYPDHYLRQQNGQLYFQTNDQTAQFPLDATLTLNPAP